MKAKLYVLDFEKRSALHAAAFRGDPIITKLLIDHGARVNTKDCKWVTPLHRACYSGSEVLLFTLINCQIIYVCFLKETVTILLNNSADTCARDRLWQTPLHIAAACNSLECVSYLLDRIQNPNVTDRSGRTALHHAVLNGHNDIVELLISRGCIVNACDKKDCRYVFASSKWEILLRWDVRSNLCQISFFNDKIILSFKLHRFLRHHRRKPSYFMLIMVLDRCIGPLTKDT